MKKVHILIGSLCLLILPLCSIAQTSDVSAEQTEFSLNIAKNILKAAGGLTNDFANFKGDFQEMSVQNFSEMTYYSALSWSKLGERAQAKKLFRELLVYAKQLQKSQAKIDYFATSLPTMLLFNDNLQFRQETTALFLRSQAQLGLGKKAKAKSMLQAVLQRDPNHAPAIDLLSSFTI